MTIPENVTTIETFAFGCCSGLTLVEWKARHCQDFSTNSPFSTYMGTPSLTSITFGREVEHIPAYLCNDCGGLMSVTIPESVTSIGSQAFSRCRSLTSVTIPESVTSIGYWAFGATSIGRSLYNSKVFAYMPTDYSGEYVIPSGILSIAGGAFNGCSGLTSVTIPNSVTSIGANAFSACSGLTSVTIPNSVTSIGLNAFAYSGLRSVTLGKGIDTIGHRTFWETALESVTSLSTKPPYCEPNSYYGTYEVFGNHSATLYVPHGCKESYQSAEEWREFSEIKELSDDPSDPDNPTANENAEADNFRVYVQDRTIYLSEDRGMVQVYNMAGQCVYNGHATAIPVQRSGVYILVANGKRLKVLVK